MPPLQTITNEDLLKYLEGPFDDSGEADPDECQVKTPKSLEKRKVDERYAEEKDDSVLKESTEKKKPRESHVDIYTSTQVNLGDRLRDMVDDVFGLSDDEVEVMEVDPEGSKTPNNTHSATRYLSFERTIQIEDEADNIMTHHRSVVCLLYTSPSPRDATLSRMPSSA